MKHKLSGYLFLGALFFNPFFALGATLEEYGRQCRETLGVPVPSFDCEDPKASLFNQGEVRRGGCERPHGSVGPVDCTPGSKLLRYDDEWADETGRRQKVSTIIFCRGRKGNYKDIAVIQVNEAKNASCWFSQQTNPPGGRVPSPNAVPSAEGARNFWGATQPNMNCRECHDNGLLIRSPAVARIENEPNKGYQRTGRRGNYEAGTGNALPDFSDRMSKDGAWCNVGDPWPDNINRERFPEIKINSNAFRAWNRTLPLNRQVPPSNESSIDAGYCTSCHYVGAGDRQNPGARFSCNILFPDSIGRYPNSLRRPNNFLESVWMPPAEELTKHGIDSKEKYDKIFAEPIAALKACCENPNLEAQVGGQRVKVCNNKFSLNGRRDSLSQRGPCALLEAKRDVPRENSNSGGTNKRDGVAVPSKPTHE